MIKILQIKWVTICVFIFSATSINAAQDHSRLLDSYLKICADNPEGAKADLQAYLKDYPEDFDAYLLLSCGLPFQGCAFMPEVRARIENGLAPATEKDRLLYALTLGYDRSIDLKRIQDLLDFKSSNPTIEANRIIREAELLYLQDRKFESVKKMETAFGLSKFMDPFVLYWLTLSFPDEAFSIGFREKYRPEIEKLGDGDPWKKFIRFKLRESEDEASIRPSDLEEARYFYDLCQYDFAFADSYATKLYEMGRFEEAYDVHIGLTEAFPEQYSVDRDYMLAVTAAWMKDFETAVSHMNKVNESEELLSPVFRDDKADFEAWIRDQAQIVMFKNFGWIAVVILVAFLLLLGQKLYSVFRKS